MSSRELIYLSAAFGGFFLCLALEIITLRMGAKRLAALKRDLSLTTTERK